MFDTTTPITQPAAKKARKKCTALPPGAEENNRFRGVFIPTYERWVGTQANPWVIPDDVAIPVLQAIWDTVYKDVPWTVNANDCVFERVCYFSFLRGGEGELMIWLGHTASLRMAQLLQMRR